jgi:signal transduction histidine kinase
MKNMEKLRSLSTQLITAFALVIMLSGALFVIVTYQTGKSEAQLRAQVKLDSVMAYLLAAVELPIWSMDINTVRYIGESVAQDVTIEQIIITDTGGEVLFEGHKGKRHSSVSGKVDIYHSERLIGEVEVSVSKAPFEARFNESIRLTIIALVLEVGALIVFAGVLLRRIMRKPFSELEQIVSHYSEGDYKPHAQGSSYVEFKTTAMVLKEMGSKILRHIGELKNYQEDLELQVQERTAELVKARETAESRTAELRAANEELEAFTYSVSHDLRAPVRHISGFAQVLLEDAADSLDSEAKDCLNTIEQSAVKMGALIDDLLRLSKLGRQALSITDTDVDALARNVWGDVQASTGFAGEFHMDPLPRAKADQAMLQVVWRNLLENAAKFSAHSQLPRITVRSGSVNGKTSYIVEDNGAGFDQRYADKLFSVFQRLHQEKEFSGTGVGLAIVHRIVTRHGGGIRAVGEIGKGATFEFWLGAKVA